VPDADDNLAAPGSRGGPYRCPALPVDPSLERWRQIEEVPTLDGVNHPADRRQSKEPRLSHAKGERSRGTAALSHTGISPGNTDMR